ncbi:MAG: cytochrome c [Gemmatimonadota bacterium]
MSKVMRCMLVAGLGATAAIALPQPVFAQRSGVETWSVNCARCHNVQPPDRYSSADWASIGTHMAITARLTKVEIDAVLSFLMSGARDVTPEAGPSLRFADPRMVYAQQCAACHGEGAGGDGPAARAFNPAPTDLSTPDFWASRSDAQIDSVIAFGKNAMPPQGRVLDTETRMALIRYLRELHAGS